MGVQLLNWATVFPCLFFEGKHANLLELDSLVSLHRRVVREAIQAPRLLVLVDRAWFWEPSQKDDRGCLAYDIAL